MNLASLSSVELQRRLAADGLAFRTGPFAVRLHSAIASVAEGIQLLYGEYPLLPDEEFVDFFIALQRPRGLRRWWRPQVEFAFDGRHPFKPLPYSQSFPMFEWTYNWCIANHMHNYLIVHGAVVERDGHAAILPAPPGSGKSTLCAALVNRGWRLFSDELALISLLDNRLVPLPRPVSLKNESIAIMHDFAPLAVFGPEYRDTRKGTVAHMKAPSTSIARYNERARAAWIIMPRYVPGAAATLTPISNARTCLALAQNAFNYSLLGETGFNALTQVMAGCASYEFSYSRLEDAIAVFDALEVQA